jgi:hypothetical protein
MSMPNIPDITPNINITREEVINLLLASIALEELGLAHIINAEGEKIQAVIGDSKCNKLEDLVKIDKSVQTTLRDVIKKEILLEFKLENILELISVSKGHKD